MKALQDRPKAVVDSGITLVDVVHVILLHRVLPLQTRATPMWRYKPEGEVELNRLFRGADLGGMRKLLFKTKKDDPTPRADDMGFNHTNPTTEVLFLFQSLVFICRCFFLTGWSNLCFMHRCGVRGPGR